MNSNNLIDYFNEVSNEIFEVLSEIKYSVRLLEINQENRFIGFSVDTEYFSAQITILTPNNRRYILNRSCSMQLYSFDDENLDSVLYESRFRSIEECATFLIDQDIASLINMPKYHLN